MEDISEEFRSSDDIVAAEDPWTARNENGIPWTPRNEEVQQNSAFFVPNEGIVINSMNYKQWLPRITYVPCPLCPPPVAIPEHLVPLHENGGQKGDSGIDLKQRLRRYGKKARGQGMNTWFCTDMFDNC